MHQTVSISIIMGVYNTSDPQMLQNAITSIQNQSFTDWEWIICDDGSSDDTYGVLKSLVQMDKRIRLIRNKKNLGLAATLNHCLKYASGKYIARMDADDISHLQRLEKEIRFLEQNPQYQLVGTAAELFNENGSWGKRRLREKPKKTHFLWGSPFIHPTVMIRRDILMQAGGYRVSKETRRAEDYDLFMRLYAKGYRGYNLQEILYYFCEDQTARKRKKYRYRFDEAKIRWKGFCRLGLMPWGIPYVLKPLIVGLIPYPVRVWLRGDKY